MTNKNELEEDIGQISQELDWIKKRLIQVMWAQEELDMEERALQSRLEILTTDLELAQEELLEIKAGWQS